MPGYSGFSFSASVESSCPKKLLVSRKGMQRAIKAPELSASAKGLLPCMTSLPRKCSETF